MARSGPSAGSVWAHRPPADARQDNSTGTSSRYLICSGNDEVGGAQRGDGHVERDVPEILESGPEQAEVQDVPRAVAQQVGQVGRAHVGVSEGELDAVLALREVPDLTPGELAAGIHESVVARSDRAT